MIELGEQGNEASFYTERVRETEREAERYLQKRAVQSNR